MNEYIKHINGLPSHREKDPLTLLVHLNLASPMWRKYGLTPASPLASSLHSCVS